MKKTGPESREEACESNKAAAKGNGGIAKGGKAISPAYPSNARMKGNK